ncbi:hypothetical protein LTR36_002664 [Oleoguttula mirabilis]|uniref:Ubiquitin-conjugating enzyme E2 Z n=1 Tax=Oleoguttula mirabilis TaxID=1507867 RepID=A0AAV9JJX3_9PEZI|nr:hypothetical protein LTR36_002664 [Oleoguttula mirabilis]
MATPNTSGGIARITKEIAHIERGDDLSLAVACRDSDVRNVRALIIGPPETPYEFGFFEFDVKFSKEYPITSPGVRCITTNGGRCRFNPNIYNEGKVCLSILGTWRGNAGEEWSSAQGLESVMLSIQSLMSQNPYENEPGYETAKKDEPTPKAYVAKITHETLRIAVIQRLEGLLGLRDERRQPTPKRPRTERTSSSAGSSEFKSPKGNTSTTGNSNSNGDAGSTSGANTPATEPSVYEYDAEATFNAFDQAHWDPFADLMKRRFLWYYDSYVRTVREQAKQHPQGTAFTRMEFEFPPNSMEGNFDYKSLLVRLESIKQALDDEQGQWVKTGAKQVAQETQLAVQLAFQFKQLEHKWNDTQYDGSRMELSLPDKKNPFAWSLALFGKPMTNLDGGIFSMTLCIPPNFPAIQPRLKIETPMFHHRVSSTGTLCYFPKKEDELASHLEAIVAALENDDPRFDPRAVVSPEAFTMYWGGEEKRKIYNRKLRRSAQESSEY